MLSDNLTITAGTRPHMLTNPDMHAPAASKQENIAPISRRPLLSVTVTDTLRAKIESATWAPGERVPTEKDLSAQLNVSRATVREALTRLIGHKSALALHAVNVAFVLQSGECFANRGATHT